MPSPVTYSVLGHAVLRSEDPDLLTGHARYVADQATSATLHLVFVRSVAAHGVVRSIDTRAATEMPGVVGVFTNSDIALAPQGGRPGSESLARPAMAADRVRFVGEAVAAVVATGAGAAVDAAEQVVVDIDLLPSVTDPVAAARAEAPLLFAEHGSNVVSGRDAARDDAFFADAEVVVKARLTHHRVAPVPLEPNALLVVPTEAGGVEVWASTQSVFGVRDAIAGALRLEPDQVRVRAPWVGGGFGAKGGVYPEQLVVAAAAHRLQQPVLWVETRSENMVAMTHGRAQVHEVELGATHNGRFTGLRVKGWADLGAYAGRGGFIPRVTRAMSSGAYAIPKIDFSGMTVVTNTSPTGPYRGAGRPEAAALTERIVDVLADALDIDPVELRRRNFPDPADFPFTTAAGTTYDSGDYAKALDEALRLADYDALRAEQTALRASAAGPLMGIGVACYVETSGGGQEFGKVEVDADGTILVFTGSVPHGQGHETTFAQIAASVLGVSMADVRVIASDTALIDHGTGTFGSRSLQLGGSAVHQASEQVLDQARSLAADLLEAAPEDIVAVAPGRLGVVGVPESGRTWAELAVCARELARPLAHELDFGGGGSNPSGCHVAVVDIDRETGQVTLRRMIAVDDCGVVINPALAEGQVHGGLAQGIAQMLYEAVTYDDDGNPLTTTLLDYAVPSAADLPSFETAHVVTPSPNNPLGAKGIGESGTTGAISAVWNAVVDALSPFGVRHLDGPFRPETVWRAMQGSPSTVR